MAVFCNSLTSCFPAMLLTYFLNDFEIVPVAPIITGITFVFTFHMRYTSILRSLYFRNFSVSLLITFLSPEIATFINIHVPFSLSRIIMSGLLLGIVLSVCTCWFHNVVTLPPWLVSTDFGTRSYQCFCPIVPLLLLLLLLLLQEHDHHAWTFISFHIGNLRPMGSVWLIDNWDASWRLSVNPLYSLKISHIAAVPEFEFGSSLRSWSTVVQTSTGNYKPTMPLRYCYVVYRTTCDVSYSVSLCVDCSHPELQTRCAFYCISLRVFFTERPLIIPCLGLY